MLQHVVLKSCRPRLLQAVPMFIWRANNLNFRYHQQRFITDP